MKTQNVPMHIAIIPDGNRRWAKKHGLPSFEGHRRGANLAEVIAKHARSRGIKTLTFWALSTENFNREKKEVDYLMKILEQFLGNIERLIGENTRFFHIGQRDRLSKKLLKKIEDLEEKTKHHTEYYFNLAIDYGGRREIIVAVEKILRDKPSALDENIFSQYLYTHGQPDPDLIIRTGGDKRLSGLMPWQSVYSELYFTDLLWPDFDEKEFDKAIEDYISRERRFGK